MPGTLGIMPNYGVPKGGGGKGPKFPMPLDHPSSGLGIKGGVNAEQRPVRGGVTAYKPPPRGIPRAAPIKAPAGLRVHPNPLLSRVNQEQRSQRVREGPKGPGYGTSGYGVLAPPRARPGGPPHGLLATALSIPAEIGNVAGEGVFKAGQIGAKVTGQKGLELLGKVGKEAINIPAQAPEAAFLGGYAGGRAVAGHPEEAKALGKSYLENSAVAHFFKGEFSKAVDTAKKTPLNTGLEVSGVVGAGDRILAGLDSAAAGGRFASKLAGEGAGTTPAREYPQGMAPEGLTAPGKPFNKGLVRGALERRGATKPLPGTKGEKALREAFDSHEADVLHITRNSNAKIDHLYYGTKRKPGPLRLPGREAIHHFAKWMADPNITTKDGTPLYRKQIAEAIKHWERKPPDELPHHETFRNEVVAHLKELSAHPHEHFVQAYHATKDLAEKARALEPELIKHGIYTGDTMRISKLIHPFQFHFRDEQPWVDTTVTPGESPFKLGGPEGRTVSVDEVARKLKAKGVDENQLIFGSTRPFQTEAQARVSGYKEGGRKEHVGSLTGQAFLRGHWDPSPEALLRQHLTTQKALDIARATTDRARFPLQNSDLAGLIEKHLTEEKNLTPENRAALERTARQLRAGAATGKRGRPSFDNQFFHDNATGSAAEQARNIRDILASIGYEDLRPVRIAHRYASTAYRQALGAHLNDIADLQDRLEPSAGDHLPDSTVDENTPRGVGPIALAHKTIANRMREYDNNLGSAHLKQLPGTIWRMANVAFSPRHPIGVAKEQGIRAAAHNIGPFSMLRGSRLRQLWHEQAERSTDPNVKYSWQRIEARTGGTHAGYALNQTQHIPLSRLQDTWMGKPRGIFKGKNATTGKRVALSPIDAWLKGETHKMTGFPLRAMKHVVGAGNKVTKAILREQARYIEKPPTVAGLGKHYAEQYKNLTGKRLPLLRSYNKLEQELMRGLLNPRSVDEFSHHAMDYWGDWMNSPPKVRSAQAAVPFFRWYTNALRFVYHIMPYDHPIQTGLLAALETATREVRQAEGQEYRDLGQAIFSKVGKGQLAPYQQGSQPNIIPEPLAALEGKPGRQGEEYYSPPGAVSQGVAETLRGAIMPYATAMWYVMEGRDPTTHEPIEERNPKTGRKVPLHNWSKLGLKAVLAALENFAPPVRWVSEATEGKKPSYIFRPIRTEKEHLELGEKGEPVKLQGLKPEMAAKLLSKLRVEERSAKEAAKKARREARAKAGGLAPPPPPPPPPPAPPPPPPP